MSLESQLDVLEDALPPTSRFAAWIDATMRGDAELARKLEEGGGRIETAFVWRPFGFYVQGAIEVAQAFWHEVHLAFQMRRALEMQQRLMGYLLEEFDFEKWQLLDTESREAYDPPDPQLHPHMARVNELLEMYLVKLASYWRGFERFAHGEGFDARMMLYALEWPPEMMEEIEEIVELVADVQAPNERIEFTRKILLATYAKQINRLSGDQCETRAYPETLTEFADGRA